MALWEKAQQLSGGQLEELKALYGAHFPIEVRHYLASWIESQSWHEIQPDNIYHQPEAAKNLEMLLRALQDLSISGSDTFIIRTQLEGLRTHMMNMYQSRPLELVRVIQNILLQENKIVKRHETLNSMAGNSMLVGGGVQLTSNSSIIQRGLETCNRQTQMMQENYHALHSKQEQFVIQYQEVIKLQGILTQGQGQHTPEQMDEYRKKKEKMEGHLSREVEEMHQMRQELGEKYNKCLQEISNIQSIVLDQELAQWKRTQRMNASEESPNKKELDQLQQWCEQLAEMLWRNRVQIRQYEQLQSNLLISNTQQHSPYSNLIQVVNELLNKLISESFIVEKQPPQVMKTNNRFTAEVRLLVGSKLNIHMSTPEVTVSIINEKQAKALHHSPMATANDNVGEILNCKKNMEYQQTSQNVCCKFNFMQLKRVKRSTDKKGSDQTVTEEKFALLFQSKFSINGELDVSVKVLSLPVVVVVHGSQTPAAEVTIFWDNSFADLDREPFVVPESVPWPTFGDCLNRYFTQQTGKGLTQKNLDYLAKRLMGMPNANATSGETDLSHFMVTRQIVVKDHLQNRPFTFWEWFYKTCELIKTCLRREWNAGLILGFMDKREAHETLMMCQPGTFLVRFTESEPGGVSVVWVKSNGLDKQVFDLAPWNRSSLVGMRSFADRVHDLTHLFLLYPNTPKDEAFGNFYSQEDEEQEFTQNGYLKHNLKVVIPSLTPNMVPMHSFPNSPASSIISSHGVVSPRMNPSFVGSPQSMHQSSTYPNSPVSSINSPMLQQQPRMDNSNSNFSSFMPTVEMGNYKAPSPNLLPGQMSQYQGPDNIIDDLSNFNNLMVEEENDSTRNN